jgi:hypothetical protein
MLHPIAVDWRWPKGFGRPAMCASSVEPFSVERGSFVSKAMARHDDELLPVDRLVRGCPRQRGVVGERALS